MNIADAAYHTVHDYPGGTASLAPRVGTSVAVLNSKVNPNTTTHHLTLREAVILAEFTKDDRMLKAWAHESGYVLVRAPSAEMVEPDMAVLEKVLALGMAGGQLMATIHAALADGKVDQAERKAVNRAKLVLQTIAEEAEQCLHGVGQ